MLWTEEWIGSILPASAVRPLEGQAPRESGLSPGPWPLDPGVQYLIVCRPEPRSQQPLRSPLMPCRLLNLSSPKRLMDF